MTKPKKSRKPKADKDANAPEGAFVRPARLPRECRWARARLRGWNDYVDGKSFRASYDLWQRKAQFAYERGRMQAALASAKALRKPGHWKMDELIEGPLFRACGEVIGRQILEETRSARHR